MPGSEDDPVKLDPWQEIVNVHWKKKESTAHSSHKIPEGSVGETPPPRDWSFWALSAAGYTPVAEFTHWYYWHWEPVGKDYTASRDQDYQHVYIIRDAALNTLIGIDLRVTSQYPRYTDEPPPNGGPPGGLWPPPPGV